jgi:hypothetical protein
MNTIKENWLSYAKQVMNPKAGLSQVKETQQAFYAGSVTVLKILTEIASGEYSDAAGVQIMDGLHQECLMYLSRFASQNGIDFKKVRDVGEGR